MEAVTAEHVTVKRTVHQRKVHPGDVITAGEVQILIGAAKAGSRYVEIDVPIGTTVEITRLGASPKALSKPTTETGANP